jgi:lipopolysaccharide export system protein LptA
VWTPKRIVLLAAGFVVFFSSYVAYASFLGGIDGLPPLPECYLSKVDYVDGGEIAPRAIKRSAMTDKVKEAFGPECKELNYPIQLELHAKRTLLTARDFKIEPDGRLQLRTLGLALFGADKGDGRGIEINTLCADHAYLTFDRPIGNLGEIGSRKIVAAELFKNITVTNNHRTAARDDDLHVFINHGPLYFDDAKHLIWTKDDVYVRDDLSKPKPTEIRGHMMDMELMTEGPPAKPAAPRKAKGENITGVKSIVLHSDVEMNLYVDGQSGFPGGTREPSAKPSATKAASPPEKAHVRIKTPGKFRYEIYKDHDFARFDVPEGELAESLKRSPQDVVASRFHESLGEVDQLVCKHLELRLHRKESTEKQKEASSAPSAERGLEIETARATGPDGLVTLTSDAEKLRASGSDFFYDAGKMLTVLKGQPTMEAEKDHNVIRATELQIQDHKPTDPGAKPYQTATGIGPGTVDLIDKDAHHDGQAAASGAYRKVMRAAWRDKLISTKDGPNDLLIFTGAANFLDYEHNQTLSADTLKVWLLPAADGQPAKSQSPVKGQAAAKALPTVGGQPADKAARPEHLEAIGNVTAHSAEMNLHDTGRLVVWFKDVPSEGKLPVAVTAVATPVKSNVAIALPASTARPLPAGPVTAPPAVAPAGPAPAPKAAAEIIPGHGGHNPNSAPAANPDFVGPPQPPEPPRPIDLSARSVEVWVLRSPERNTLDRLWAEGKPVHVHQDPAGPDEKGVDILGETLQLTSRLEGNFLVVTGDVAELLMDKIYICGPEVNIDQATNKAWVTGFGGMKMESKTNFQGDQLAKPVPLEVTWHKSMLFDGNYAEFHEDVQAEQENAHLLCHRLEVHFDRPISLKEGSKGDQPPARVQTLVCDGSVRITEETKDGDKTVKFQSLTSPAVSMRALEADEDGPPPAPGTTPNTGNEVRASGPGALRLMQAGSGDPNDPPGRGPAPAAKKNDGKEGAQMKMTYVTFDKSMYANSKKNKADFYENVRVLNFPCDNPRINIDFDTMLEKMPEGGIYLRCEQMEVLNRPVKGGKSHQEMTAVGHVTVQSDKVTGNAAKVTYNEEKDQLIFDSVDQGYATIYKTEIPGGEPKKFQGKKIIYIRKTGECNVQGGSEFSGR